MLTTAKWGGGSWGIHLPFPQLSEDLRASLGMNDISCPGSYSSFTCFLGSNSQTSRKRDLVRSIPGGCLVGREIPFLNR